MHVLIIGAAGMVGRKLAERLANDGAIGDTGIETLTLYDVIEPRAPASATFKVERATGDLPAAGEAARLIASRPDVIFHLAAVVSGEAEQDFDKGYAINMDGTRNLLEAIRAAGEGYKPRFLFASSIAVFGAPFPAQIPDNFFTTPLTSYGTQKAICELLISDYARRGMVDGLSIRLPTICVRPGAPNAAASGFFSNIIREPIAGEEAVLPVAEEVVHTHASPRSATNFFIHAATLDLDEVGPRRALSMPGVGVSVGEQIEALRRVGGERVVARIKREPDPFIQGIVAGWPTRFDAVRARELGFEAEPDFDAIIRAHIEDERDGVIA